jgi:tetratricopeptide (TPR) repeat protein
MNKKQFIYFVLFFVLSVLAVSQELDNTSQTRNSESSSFFTLQVFPSINIPFGESADYFKAGFATNLRIDYDPKKIPLVFGSAELGYELSPIQAQESLSIISTGVGGGLTVKITPRIGIKAFLNSGFYYSLFNTIGETARGGNPYFYVGIGTHFILTPKMDLGIDISYKNYLGLKQGINISLVNSFYLTGQETRQINIENSRMKNIDLLQFKTPEIGEGIEVSKIEYDQVFPVFYSYYDSNPLGRVTIRNLEDKPITDIKVSLYVKEYMNTPKECLILPEIPPMGTQEIDLFALFTKKVLEITEGTKVGAELILEYKMRNQIYHDTKVTTLLMYDRNAMTWDDDRKAAAFITAKDPNVLSFSKNVTGILSEYNYISINENLLKAMAIHEALSLYGLTYALDPKTPYDELSQNKSRVDYLQFPRHTLEYRAGDCDDLSILYCALLESVAVETAFITIPGHIFMAFSLDMTASEAKSSFIRPEDLVFKENKVWLPLEITEQQGGFLKAWQTGAKEWRDNILLDQAGFFPVSEAWEIYKPVGLPYANEDIEVPIRSKIANVFQLELSKFIEKEIYPRVTALQKQIVDSNERPSIRNRLGVLYARYDLMKKAEEEFRKILLKEEFVPALINLGNIYFIREEWDNALSHFQRAAVKAPSNMKIQISLARTYYELGNFPVVKNLYERVKNADAPLAERYTYMDFQSNDSNRASGATRKKGDLLWVEE